MNNNKGFSIRRFKSIVKKEFIQILRDPISLRLPIFMPVFMMLLFGYAVKTEVEHISTVVFDQSNTQESRDYIDSFVSSNYFKIAKYIDSEQEMADLLDSGKTKAVLVIPSDFSKDLKRKKSAQVQLIIEGTDPTTARTAFNSGLLISEIYSRNLQQKSIKKMGASSLSTPSINLNTKVWYNPNLDSNRFTIPGLVGLILQNITIMLTAFALVREKERGTIEQLIVTPIKPLELILGKLIPYVIIGYAGFLFALGICVFWFRVEITGSVWLLLILGFLFVFCSLSIGMLVSTFAKNQLQSMMFLMIIILPSVLLSGFIFPREAMPIVIRLIGYFIPLTYFLDITRGIALKGVGVKFLWNDIIALSVFTILLLLVATKRFRKSLD